MKMSHSKNNSPGPSSAIGIMRFKDSMKGPKISPNTVVIVSVVFIILILVIKMSLRI